MRATDIGFQYMRDATLRYVALTPGVADSPDRSWSTFIFDRRFADRRHAPSMLGGQYRSALSALLEVLNDRERQLIFSGIFDIGNGRKVPRASRSYAALERDLAHGRRGYEPLLKPIKRKLHTLLGMPVQQYFAINPDVTLKVLKLLFTYQHGTDSCLSCSRLFSFLELPDQRRPSFEFRPSFEINGTPKIEEAADKQRIIDELTVHLGSELGGELREKARSTFMGLANDVGVAENLLRQKLNVRARGTIGRYRQACAEAQNGIVQLRDIYSKGRAVQRLDLDLLIFLGRVQVENRNNAHSEIIDAIKQTQPPVEQIEVDLIRLNANFDLKNHGRAINIEVIEASEIEQFLVHWAIPLRDAMAKALGVTITDHQYASASRTARMITAIDPAYKYGAHGITMLDVIGLLCTAHAAAEHRSLFRYKPYWHGQKNQSDRPFHQLDDRASCDVSAIPEGRVVYWRHCQTWIKSALIGQLPIWELNQELTTWINEALSRVMATHDLEAMQGFVTALGAFAADK